jgi:hypothetical protein
MGALTVAGVALAVGGLSAVRDSTVGRYQRTLAATDPGYQASVVPTPTMGVLTRDGDGRLAGAAVLSLAAGDATGSVTLVPVTTLVRSADRTETTLDAVYAEQGAAAAVQALGETLVVAVPDSVELDDAAWEQLVAPVGSVPVVLETAVADWPEGQIDLRPSQVGRFLSAIGAGEADLARVERHQAFWNAWLPEVHAAGEDTLPGEADTGIGRFVRAIAAGGGAASAIPVGREDTRGGVRYRPDARQVGEYVSATIPYPTSPVPGARFRVRLLNGTDDLELTHRAARALVASGAEIAIVGNAATFSEPRTRLLYVGPEAEDAARWIAASLGVGRPQPAGTRQDGGAPDDDVDVTVILGKDAEGTIGREQNPD